jgi:hypothetical protein
LYKKKEKKNEIITGFISFLQLVALASKPSVVYQEIKFTKRFENVSYLQRIGQ